MEGQSNESSYKTNTGCNKQTGNAWHGIHCHRRSAGAKLTQEVTHACACVRVSPWTSEDGDCTAIPGPEDVFGGDRL